MLRNTNKKVIIWGVAFALSVLAVLSIRALVNQAPDDLATSPVAEVWLQVALVIFLSMLVTVHTVFKRSKDIKNALTVSLFSIFMASLPIIMLHSTPYALNGVDGDQSFRTASITKFATTWKYVDFSYKDLPSFYPPLYYYILGRTADIFGLAPYAMSKIGLIATTFVLPFVIFGLWSPLVGTEIASLVPFVLLIIQNWYKPSGMLSSSIFLPWWLYFIDEISRQRLKWWKLIIGGLIGSIAFQIYYFWFFVGGFGIFLSVLYRTATWKWTDEFTKSLLRKFSMLAITALFSAPFWLPFLLSMARTGGWKQMQTRDCGPGVFSLPFFEISIVGLFLLVGLFYLLVTYSNERKTISKTITLQPLSLDILRIVSAAYFMITLGYLGYLTDRPFKPYTIMFLVKYLLLVGFIMTVILWGKKFIKRIRSSYIRRAVYIVASLLFIFVTQRAVRELATHKHLDAAHSEQYPESFLDDFENVTGEDHIGKVVLADFSYQGLAVYLPVNEFIAWNAHYSHPAGLFNERVAFLHNLSKIQDPALFAKKLMNNPYDRIDAIVMEAVKEDYRLKYGPDTFPYKPSSESIWFPQYLFNSQYFDVHVERFNIGNTQDEFVIIIPQY